MSDLQMRRVMPDRRAPLRGLGTDRTVAVCLENIARFLDVVGESVTRAAERAREVLYTEAEMTSGGTAKPST